LGFSNLCHALSCSAHSISFSAFSGLVFIKNPSVEYSILAVSSIVGVGSLLPGYFRQHRKLMALFFLAPGLFLIGIGRFAEDKLLEGLFTSVGAATVACSHFINFRLCANCKKI